MLLKDRRLQLEGASIVIELNPNPLQEICCYNIPDKRHGRMGKSSTLKDSQWEQVSGLGTQVASELIEAWKDAVFKLLSNHYSPSVELNVCFKHADDGLSILKFMVKQQLRHIGLEMSLKRASSFTSVKLTAP